MLVTDFDRLVCCSECQSPHGGNSLASRGEHQTPHGGNRFHGLAACAADLDIDLDFCAGFGGTLSHSFGITSCLILTEQMSMPF